MQDVQLTCPPHLRPGDTMEFTLPPDTRPLKVQIPAGVGPGGAFVTSVPVRTAAAVADPSRCKIIQTKDVASTKWLKLQSRTYVDAFGRTCAWDLVGRSTRPPGATADGVNVVALLHGGAVKKSAPDTLLVRQYRPPVGAHTLELPAGIIDAGETAQAAALRELKEETGFVGAVRSCSPPIALSPGMSDELVHVVVVEIDLAAAPNRSPKQILEEGEQTVVVRLKLADLFAEVGRAAAKGDVVCAGLYRLALGLSLGIGAFDLGAVGGALERR